MDKDQSEQNIMVNEVKEAVRKIKLEKSPGHDRLTWCKVPKTRNIKFNLEKTKHMVIGNSREQEDL